MKGEETRRRIVEAAAELINRKGYSGMSMSDLMEATGLEKGGIYRHFDSKESIAAAAFEKYVKDIGLRLGSRLEGLESPKARLIASIHALGAIGWDPIVKGGCMVMNLAIESDYTELPFRPAARQAIRQWRALIQREARAAVSAGELRPDLDANGLASIIISAIEGAIMLSGIEGDAAHARRVIAHLETVIEGYSV